MKSKLKGIVLSKYYEGFWFAIGVVYGIILIYKNYVHIFDNAFWGDELFTIRLARMSIKDMLTATAADVHPPLHYFIEIFLNRLLGDYGYVYHLGAFIPFALSIVFILTVIWKSFGKVVGFIMLTFTGISPNAVRFNVEARMYSLAYLFILVVAWAFYYILKSDILKKNCSLDRLFDKSEGLNNSVAEKADHGTHKLFDNLALKYGTTWPYAVFIISSLGAAYSHYYAALSVAFFYLALLIFVIRKQLNVRKLIIVYGLTILGYLPWLFSMFSTFERTANDFWMKDIPDIGESIKFFYRANPEIYSYVMFGITIIVFVYWIFNSFMNHSFPAEVHLMIWCMISSLGTIAVGMLVSILVRPVYLDRYLYPICAAMFMCLAIGISKFKYGFPMSLVIILLSFRLFIPSYLYTVYIDNEINNRNEETVAYLNGIIGDNSSLIGNYQSFYYNMCDYYFPGHEALYYDGTDSLWDNINDTSDYWLVVQNSELDEDYIAQFSEHGYTPSKVYSEGVIGNDIVWIYHLIR